MSVHANIVNALQRGFRKMNVYVAVRAVIVIVLQALNPLKTKGIKALNNKKCLVLAALNIFLYCIKIF